MPLTDSQKIAVIYDRSERMERAMFGPFGVVERLTRVENQATTTDSSAAGKKEKMAAWAAIVVALITSFSAIVVGKSG